MLGSFPMAAYLLGTSPKGKDLAIAQSVKDKFSSAGTSDVALSELNHVIDSKAREIHGLDVKILENQGTILRLEEEKKTVLKDLEAFQNRLTTIIHDIKKDDMAPQR
jgi:hypothetical protein